MKRKGIKRAAIRRRVRSASCDTAGSTALAPTLPPMGRYATIGAIAPQARSGGIRNDAPHYRRHVCALAAAGGEDAPPAGGVRLPGSRAATGRKARIGAAQPVRPGRAADA